MLVESSSRLARHLFGCSNSNSSNSNNSNSNSKRTTNNEQRTKTSAGVSHVLPVDSTVSFRFASAEGQQPLDT